MENILKFYILANNLKTTIRTGWSEVGISKERLESVAEHVYGTLILALALDSEKQLDLDLLKLFKMIIVKELTKVTNAEKSVLDGNQNNNIEEISKVTAGLMKQEELKSLYSEYVACESKEAKFAFQLSKIESDIQAKLYDLEGHFDYDKAIEDAKKYPDNLQAEIIPQVKNASDAWILFDRQYYSDAIFKELSEEIQKLTN